MDTLGPKSNDKLFTMGIHHNGAYIAFKKYNSPTLALRLGLSANYSIRHTNIKNQNVDHSIPFSSMYIYNSSDQKTSDLGFSLFTGFQKSVGVYKGFEPYLGLDLQLGCSYIKNSVKNNSVYSDSYPGSNPSGSSIENEAYYLPKASLLPFVGINYYLTPRFSIGAEYRITLLEVSTYSTKSKSNIYSNGTVSIHNPSKTTHTDINGRFSGIGYITASYFLRR